MKNACFQTHLSLILGNKNGVYFNLDNLVYYILVALAALISLSVHEFAHGYMAYKLGDDTARNLGRLTINPLKHIDPFGAICMILFRFGWAKPVPINARNFKKPKRDFALVAMAGPIANIILSFLGAFLYLLTFSLVKDIVFTEKNFLFHVLNNLLTFLFAFHSLNIGLAIFNLIPIPPLDGSRILNVILPPKAYFGIMKYERYIYWGLIGWLLLGPYVTAFLLRFSFIATNPVLSTIAGIFSLSNILSSVMSFFSNAMISLLSLIPFLR